MTSEIWRMWFQGTAGFWHLMLPDCFCQVSNLKDAFNYVRVSGSPKRIAQNPHLWLSNKKHYQVIHVKICCKLLNLPYNWDQTYHNFNRGSEHVVLPLLLIQRLQKGMTQSRLTPIRIPDYGGGNRLGEGSTAQCCNDCYCNRFCVDSFLMYIFFLSFF